MIVTPSAVAELHRAVTSANTNNWGDPQTKGGRIDHLAAIYLQARITPGRMVSVSTRGEIIRTMKKSNRLNECLRTNLRACFCSGFYRCFHQLHS